MEFEQIGKYRILGKIGQGAMGEVFRAYDPVLKRSVAIKTMVAKIGSDEELKKRFHREAQSAARLNHPNIITVYEFSEEHGQIYLAMELLEGADLKQAIGTRALVRIDQKLNVMEQIAEGLSFAHAMDVVHRDLKPANIHILPSGQVKLMDFGLARLGASDMTATGMVMGTPHYMSPEQVRGEKADARSDIFSIGAVFYEMLTNHKPFQADSMHAVLYLVLQSEPEPMRKWVPDIPQVLVDIVEKALAKDASHRFQAGAELREALRGARRVLEPGSSSFSVVPTLAHLPGSTSPPLATRSARVEGSAALEVAASQADSGSPRPATVSSKTPTRVPEGTQVAARARSPLLYAGGAALLLAVAAAGYFLRPASRVEPPPPAAQDRVDALTQALAEREAKLAEKELADRNLAGAISHAEEALKLEPDSSAAKAVVERARALEGERDAAAAEARRAFDAGDPDLAARALARLLALEPKHPVAAELSGKLNSRFRSQAEGARRELRRAQGEAERANARSLDGFVEGVALAGEAEASMKRGEFAVATRKFVEGRQGFERSRRMAEERAAEQRAADQRAAEQRAAEQRAAEARARATPPPPTPVVAPPTAAVSAAAPAPPALPIAPPLPAGTAGTVATAPPSDEPAIRKVISDYGRAIESKDLDLFRSIKPNLSGDEEQRLRAAFQGSQRQKVAITIDGIRIAGSEATVRLTRRDTLDSHTVTSQQTISLARVGGSWVIRDIGK
jgi:serine/threonine protein kinase